MDHQHQSSGKKSGGGSSATSSSSEEINNEGQERDSTTKRSYECTFCKRGFTNAQALGGHMNIHRRDRGKAAKQAPTNPSSRNKNPDSYNHVGPTNQSPANYHDDADHLNLIPTGFNYPVFEAQRVNYPLYFQAPGLNPSNFCSAARSSNQCLVDVTTNEGVWGANLSLRTGSSNNNQVEEEIENVGSRRVVSMEDEEELDLELRLGHHP